jgi:hypothetical protein
VPPLALGEQALGLGLGDPLTGLCTLDRGLVVLGRRLTSSSAPSSRDRRYVEAEIAVEISRGEW